MASTYRLLIEAKERSLLGALASAWESNRLKLVAGGLTILVIVPAMYMLFDFLFGYLTGLEDPAFGEALARRLLSMAMMTFGIFIIVSSLISGVSTLYRSDETAFLLTLPIPGARVARFRTVESWFYAGWAMLLLGIPVVLAYTGSLRQPLAASLYGVLTFPLLVVSWLGAGSLLLAVFSRLGGLSTLWKAVGATVVLAAFGILLLISSSAPEEIVIPDAAATETAVQRFVAALPNTGWSGWPHALYGSSIAHLAAGSTSGALLRTGLMALEGALLGVLALFLSGRGFRRRFARVGQTMQSGTGSPPRLISGGGRLRAFFGKDLLLFFRDPVQWSQLGLLVGLFLLYAANLRRFPMDFDSPIWLSVAVFMNISFSGFVAATLLVRFAFPSISLEGPGLAAILQVPRGRGLLLRAKWVQSFLAVTPFMVGAGLASSLSIGAGPLMLAESAGALLLLCGVLVSINIALGALYPRFDDNNAANIASGQGGIIAAFSSTAFVLLVVASLSWVTRSYMVMGYRESAMLEPLLRAAVVLVPLSLAAGGIPMIIAGRAFGSRDVSR
jgi:ABC-2 type transport system permease protein